ncbi:Organic hydroperoxide reductase OsmC/OhrA [Flavobacterium glycines]|uniref:Organic hydroperoxide reductase OsmC/OhrA n=1 Tax=Flavobacterium glycines TaxID=551990 RepID=A0A1B9DGL8_9FLAO|nr:OsmC family protein [Flavobacterium glycines]OCB68823.1 osmotically inducible protein OsmC [Flavobacterium glycines]GEL11002.1 peroxiredoxin [Flavobacterium glycines]SDJ32941.1 Organic hydroperoxide reductase OsmC/OhrA [Flavobacterium glycines]
MAFKHLFKAKLDWNLTSKRYQKSHQIAIEGKKILNVSAAKVFKGDPVLHNPEDLLLSSVVSCHMMSYLYVCAQNGIEVISYKDNAEADLEVSHNGSGRFTEIRLYPKVIVKGKEKIAEALNLHKKANELCFIANSCNFPILHFPTCENSEFSE